MKKTILFIAFLLSFLILSSCELIPIFHTDTPMVENTNTPDDVKDLQQPTVSKTITVEFVIDGKKETKSFSSEEKIEYPIPPEKENCIFSGWFYDEAGKQPAYLGSSADEKITLYACYSYDYSKALNKISLEHIKACVSVEVLHTKISGLGVPVATHQVSGSGVIFEASDDLYYVLTNCHVVEEDKRYNTCDYSVVDCYGNSYPANLLAMDEDYDLAVVSFEKKSVKLTALPIADCDAEVGDIVIAVGAPRGLDNNITFGEVKSIQSPEEGSVGYLPFSVIWHDAPMDHGSSGGVLMNERFEILGINYAVGTSQTTNEFICGISVPSAKVLEFIDLNKEKIGLIANPS